MVRARNPEVDLLRSFALVGICIVNLPLLALYDAPEPMRAPTGLDEVVYFAGVWLLEGKVFPLFAFMFGWGIVGQQQAALREGKPFALRYARRLSGLLVLGVLNALLVYTGDILVLYALLGLLIWPVIDWQPRRLVALAFCTIPIAMVASAGLGILFGSGFGLISNGPDIVTFLDAVAYRQLDWPASFCAVVLFNGAPAFAGFALGLAAARVGFLEPGNLNYQRLRRYWPILASTGLAVSLIYALAETGFDPAGNDAFVLAGMALGPLGALFLSTAYFIAIVELARHFTFPQAFVATGKSSLTTYILQGLVGGALLSGYGLSLGARMGAAGYLVTALVICGVTMLFARTWQIRFRRGPLEEILRVITGSR